MSDPSVSPESQPAAPQPQQPYGYPSTGAAPMPGAYGGPVAYNQPYGMGYGYAATPTTNSMAIASMCCSIASFFILPAIGAVLGIVFGYMARKQIADPARPDNLGGGMATAGIIAGWVNIGLIVLSFVLFFALAGGLLALLSNTSYR